LIGFPEKRITHDPVRMLRSIRHSVRNNFHIEDTSWSAIRTHHHLLPLCPPSRLRDELLNDLYSGVSADWFKISDEAELFTELFPLYKNDMVTIMPDGSTCREQLHKSFATIDRLNGLAVESGNHRQADYFHLAFLLIPWATIKFNIVDINPKGPQLYQLSKNIREEINETIGMHLNLRRSTRQEITTLLAHLPILIHNRGQKTWPKWLKRKSYFNKCRLLFRYYREVFEDVPVPDSCISVTLPDEERRQRFQKQAKSRKQGRPAFSKNRRGGVFGFKR
jgi:poly(A) polymerase